MGEVGIDITQEFPKPWTEEIVQAADVVITMGCGDACPLIATLPWWPARPCRANLRYRGPGQRKKYMPGVVAMSLAHDDGSCHSLFSHACHSSTLNLPKLISRPRLATGWPPVGRR